MPGAAAEVPDTDIVVTRIIMATGPAETLTDAATTSVGIATQEKRI